ncbi:MAG: DUF3098 domain-containing protein [Tidjanibacter sp.]|nr:DUF3098 domain-containing protein [Tidjanibacter sp.]MBQ2247800.1 DUF3098 domain-containing protein [Tidjanibacter sp.]
MKTTEKNKGNAPKGDDMVFGWSNYKWMLAGVGVILLGFVLMWGGGSGDANVFDYEGIFSWRRIGLAPIVVLAGFGIVGYSIFHKGRNKE